MLTILAMLFGQAIYAGLLCWLRNLAVLVTLATLTLSLSLLAGYACSAVHDGLLCWICCLAMHGMLGVYYLYFL
jgi:hypothetical protein